ncbi:MAG: hypothetical protein ACI9CB_001280 [Rhodothermales bacterium]|jgi:hypothetical protein
MKPSLKFALYLFFFCALNACTEEAVERVGITKTGTLENSKLDEASGIQASWTREDRYFLHNDDGKAEVFVINAEGADLGSFLVKGARNRDWEDISMVPTASGPLMVIADSGDNFAKFKSIWLYFFFEPNADELGRYSGNVPLFHAIELQYPDGARDCESIAYDSSSGKIYLLSKRDKPAGIYSIPLDDALSKTQATLSFEGNLATLRPPNVSDTKIFGKREGKWVSQPNGMDISQDGKIAALITYRSIYLFRRQDGEDWPTVLARKPVEFIGPSSRTEEAIGFTNEGTSIMVTAEGRSAPVYRIRLDSETVLFE